MKKRLSFCIVATALLSGCSGTKGQEESAQFHDRLLEIARNYQEYGRFDTEFRFAPVLCRDRLEEKEDPSEEAGPWISASGDEATHGRKLSLSFRQASKPSGTENLGADYAQQEGPNLVGQVVVKEAWQAEEVRPGEVPPRRIESRVMVRRSGKLTEEPGRVRPPRPRQGRRPLPCRSKVSPVHHVQARPHNAGRRRGVGLRHCHLADGTKVTSAGRIESCMGCHTKGALYDRLLRGRRGMKSEP